MVWLFCAGALAAQTVTVTGSVTNAITHEPLGAVSVGLFSSGSLLGANSEGSGRFRIPNVKAGLYRVVASRVGFEMAERELRIEEGGDPPAFELAMRPWPGLRGRVLDAERQPAARVRVRANDPENASGVVYEVTTDAEGRFAFERMRPGQYLLVALPPAGGNEARPTEVAPTWFPGMTDRRDAPAVPVAAGDDLSGFEIVLRAVPVFHLSGRVVDERGDPAAGATVETGLAARKATVREDGTFDLERVRPGEGTLRAVWHRGEVELRGFATVAVGGHDVEDLAVRVAPPVAVSGEIELNGQPGHECEGKAILAPVDGLGERADAEFSGSGIRFERVYPGRYRLIVEPGWKWGRHYLDSVRLGERDITLDELAVVPGMTPFRVALRTGGGRVRGTVENGAEGLVVLMPQEERLRFRPFIVVSAIEGGTFALDNVRPGDYYAFALRGSFNSDEMHNPAYARAFLEGAKTLRLERDGTAVATLVYVKAGSSQ